MATGLVSLEGPSMRAYWLLMLGVGLFVCDGCGSCRTAADEGKGAVVDLGGLKSRAPASWEEQRATGMRVAQFRVPRADGDKEDAEFVVFFFQGGGGSNEDNIKRWKGQFVPPKGKSIDDVTKVEKTKVGNADVTYVDLSGTYKFKKFPMQPDDQAELRPHYRALKVIFETPKGPYYLSLVGPDKTVEQNKKGFDEMLKGFK
jgi:hypothetical protein